jgi:hypothetical protein
MSPSERIRLSLELDLASEPIEGEVQAAGGASHPFVGWLQLTSALERAAADGEPSTNQQEDSNVP